MTPAALRALMEGDMENFAAALTPGGIQAQEAAGQQALVNSARMPLDGPWEKLEALGVKRGKDCGDGLFCECEFPAGWRKAPTDHSMWSELLDAAGKKVAMVFYKAAFYDRNAFFYICDNAT